MDQHPPRPAKPRECAHFHGCGHVLLSEAEAAIQLHAAMQLQHGRMRKRESLEGGPVQVPTVAVLPTRNPSLPCCMAHLQPAVDVPLYQQQKRARVRDDRLGKCVQQHTEWFQLMGWSAFIKQVQGAAISGSASILSTTPLDHYLSIL